MSESGATKVGEQRDEFSRSTTTTTITTTTPELECGTSLAEGEHFDDKAPTHGHLHQKQENSIDSLRSLIASDVISSSGSIETFVSPFEVPTKGNSADRKNLSVPLVYCDQTASNRPCRSIEKYISQTCLPLYGNTHTNTSVTGSQSTAFVAEARQIVAEATNAKITGKASLDVVLFAGNGTTSAVELLIDCLGVKHAAAATGDNHEENRPVVFIGPYEHHSNLLPWRESGCEIVMVPECQESKSVDIAALERSLKSPKYAHRLKMGTFSAASNVTGKVSKVDEIASVLHRHGALAFFDYATAAPYMPINMNPAPSERYPTASLVAKDAVFLSPHKMLGGIGTPGILIIKKHLAQQTTPPHRSGGGTVFYVTNTHHRFLSNRIERYEGGTPNISGIIRTGLTFLLKRQAEEQYAMLQSEAAEDKVLDALPSTILENEYHTYSHVLEVLKERAPNLVLLGSEETTDRNLPIFSFLVQCGERFLHYNYVCAILNDVFGIQSRGGCQCSGPYSQKLLGLTTIGANGVEVPNEENDLIEHALVHCKERAELLRPGYTRLSLPFKGLTTKEVDYVLRALEWVSAHGWALMCHYRCNHRTGEWRHSSRQGKPLGRTERKWLSHFDFSGSSTSIDSEAASRDIADAETLFDDALANADALLETARLDRSSIMQVLRMNDTSNMLGNDDEAIETLRWYVYPKEVAKWLSEGTAPTHVASSHILGAIHPVALGRKINASSRHGNKKTKKSEQASGDYAADASTNQNNSNSPSGSEQCTNGTFSSSKGLLRNSNTTESLIVFFRDGEHTGEAPLQEIENGRDEGELSEYCEVFDQTTNTWVPISDISSFRKTEQKEECDCAASATGAILDAHSGVSPKQSEWPTATPESTNTTASSSVAGLNAVDPINHRKKPPRDSSSWGQAPLVQINGADTLNVDISRTNGTTKSRMAPWIKPPSKLMRNITQAVLQWNMIEEGDRLLLGLSGGKDSLSLLHCLLEYRRRMPLNFTIEVCTVDPMTPSFDPSPLVPYVEGMGLKYHYIRDDIVSRASSSGKDGKVVSSLCAFCARMKRGNLYACARRNKCNKLVLAQHLDDCAESFLMSTMHNGFLRTMKANYRINAGDISVIRPMVYCRESLMTEFAKSANLPVINENCPACFEEPKERARMKALLRREEALYPHIYENIRRSLIPLMHDDATGIMRCYTEEAVSKTRKVGKNAKAKKISQLKAEKEALEKSRSEQPVLSEDVAKRSGKLLEEADEEELIRELTRRKADRFRLSGAMGRLANDGDETGQVCTLNGGNGTISCRELME